MYRALIIFVIDGIFSVIALMLFKLISRVSIAWEFLVGFVAFVMLTSMIRLIPLLRSESALEKLLEAAGNDREKLEAELKLKKRPWFSETNLFMIILLCIVGALFRFLR
jgi:hypothetical protein